MEIGSTLLKSDFILISIKGSILLILIFYAIFSLIIIRQVNIMRKTLITNISPIIRVFSIIHAGFAIGLIFLVWSIL